MPEYQVDCLEPLTTSGGDEVLRFMLDEDERRVALRIEQVNRQMVAGLPDRAIDLLEIATLVYAIDASVSRGGTVLPRMGKDWYRTFQVRVPVRDLLHWEAEPVRQALEQLLFFLSEDRFVFRFVPHEYPEAERSRFFKFGSETAWAPDRILMFSGGLDSFAGALTEIVEQGNRVALVSHLSAPKLAPIPRHLQSAINTKFGAEVSRLFPVRVNLSGTKKAEGTHRSRSFLFAALGAVFASGFGRDRVSFHENGVVSLNLPLVENVKSTRATRTTHPQSLKLMTQFLSRVFDDGMRIDNPFFWRTKTQVLNVVSNLGMAEQIAHTRSCADVHNQTKQHAHCGRCSQCIDRRFAALSAGLGAYDPAEAYKVDLFSGVRKATTDREAVLSYVRSAERYEQVTPELLAQTQPQVLSAVEHLEQPTSTALENISELLRRHGTSVMKVMRREADKRRVEEWPENTLPRMYGDATRQRMFEPLAPVSQLESAQTKLEMTLLVDKARREVVIDDIVTISENATGDLLIELAEEFLRSAGAGLNPLDYRTLSAASLAKILQLESEGAVRQRVSRSQAYLKRVFSSAGLEVEPEKDLIENLPWLGYRLNPSRVRVEKAPPTK